MKLGVNPLCWMNKDFPHLGKGISIEQCLSDIAQIGYEGLELEDPFKEVFDQLPEMLISKNLRCIGKWHSTHILQNGIEKEINRLEEHINMLAHFHGDVVVLAECSGAVHQQKETPISQRPIINENQWKVLTEGLERMAQLIQERGFTSAYHHHMGTVVETKKDIHQLMAKTKTLGLLFDTGHLVYAEEDPIDVIKTFLSRITHVHCKSVRPRVLSEKLIKDTSFFSAVIDGVFTVPGDKEEPIDFDQVIDILKNDNYAGWIVMEAEQDPTKADPFTYAKLGYDTLSFLLGRIHI